MEESSPTPVKFLDLPAELLVVVLSHASDDDYAMLVLPLVCRNFYDASVSAALTACRLASRMRQVADALPERRPGGGERLGWLIGHTWGAIADATRFFQDDTQLMQCLHAFCAAPRGSSSLLKM